MKRLLCTLAASACVTPPADPGPPSPAPDPAVTCAPDPGGPAVIGCGFDPTIGLIATADDAVFAVSGAGTFFRVGTTGETTRLFHSTSSSPVAALVPASVVVGHALYFPSLVDQGTFASFGIVSIDTTAITAGAPAVLTVGDQREPMGPIISDGTRVYTASTVSEAGGGAFVGPVIASDLAGHGLATITTDSGAPVAIVGGTLYYLHDNQLERTPTTGGAPVVVVPQIAPNARADRAADATAIYTTTAAEPYALTRFPADGGAATLVAMASKGDAEIPLGPPHDLRRDADALYYLQDLGPDYAQLVRVPVAGGAPATLFGGPALSPPVFSATALYVGYRRGGYDAPIEGAIAQLPR